MDHRKPSTYYKSQVIALKEYKKKNNCFPKKKEPLGAWCTTQKYYFRKGLLSDEKVALLKPTGLLQSGERYFCVKIDAIWDFYEKYGRTPFRDEVLNGIKIGERWYRIQRQIERCSTSESNISYVKDTYPILYQLATERKLRCFNSWVCLVRLYQKETGIKVPKIKEKFMGKAIGWWCYNQRKLAKNKALTQKQLEILNELELLDKTKVCN